jgi:hypothetical protein
VPLHLPDAEETSGTRKPLPEELRAPLALRFKVTATLLALGESGPGGLTRELETPLPSSHPHAHMIY